MKATPLLFMQTGTTTLMSTKNVQYSWQVGRAVELEDQKEHVLVCTCGYTVKQTHLKHFDVELTCKECHKKPDIIFSQDVRNINWFKYDTGNLNILECSYENIVVDDGWIVLAYIVIPHIQDEKTLWQKKYLAGMKVHHNGQMQIQLYCGVSYMLPIRDEYLPVDYYMNLMDILSPMFKRTFSIMNEEMINTIIKHPISKIKWLCDMIEKKQVYLKVPNLRKALVFPEIQEYELTKWIMFNEVERELVLNSNLQHLMELILNHRKEKSVRRAYFTMYKKQMKLKSYDPKFDYIFCRIIEDPNHLTKLLSLPMKWKFFDGWNFPDALWLIKFLKQHFGVNKIYKIFTKDYYEWETSDIKMMVVLNRLAIEKNFKKKPVKSIRDIHDLFSICIRQQAILDSNVIYAYGENLLTVECIFKDYEFRLPTDKKTLCEWAEWLNNCMCGYSEQIEWATTLIFGVFKDQKLQFAFEISGTTLEVVQASGRNNRALLENEKLVMDQYCVQYGEIIARGLQKMEDAIPEGVKMKYYSQDRFCI